MLRKMPTWIKSGLVLGILAALYAGYILASEYGDCEPAWSGMCGLGMVIVANDLGYGLPLLIFKYFAPTLDRYGDGYVFLATWITVFFFIQYFIVGAIIGWGWDKALSMMKKEKAQRIRNTVRGAGWGLLVGLLVMIVASLLYGPMKGLEEIVLGIPLEGGGTITTCNIFCYVMEFPQQLLSSRLSIVVGVIVGAILGFRRTKKSKK